MHTHIEPTTDDGNLLAVLPPGVELQRRASANPASDLVPQLQMISDERWRQMEEKFARITLKRLVKYKHHQHTRGSKDSVLTVRRGLLAFLSIVANDVAFTGNAKACENVF